MSEGCDKKKYWAFISYSSKDNKWGQWLHKRLENYPIPPSLQGMEVFDGAVLGKNLRPIFRDRDELSGSANLGPEIATALAASRFLVVLCSTNSAKSRWVNKEIEDFKALDPRNADRILALILDGEPNATSQPGISGEAECFPPALRKPLEPLAGDLRPDGDGKERGFLKILSGVAQVDFDELYKRHQRTRRKRRVLAATITGGLALVIAGLAVFAFQQRENARLLEVVAATQRELASANEERARFTLAEKDLAAADAARWYDDYAACFAHLARSLRNNPEGVEAGEIAWGLLTGGTPVYFPISSTPLPEHCLVTRFIKHGREAVSLTSDGRLILMKTSEKSPYKTLQLPEWENIVGENGFEKKRLEKESHKPVTIKINGKMIMVEAEANGHRMRSGDTGETISLARYQVDSDTWEVTTNHQKMPKHGSLQQWHSLVDSGWIAEEEADAIVEAVDKAIDEWKGEEDQYVPFDIIDQEKFRKYAENRNSDNDLVLQVPQSLLKYAGAYLMIEETGEAILSVCDLVVDYDVLPSRDCMLVQRYLPIGEYTEVSFLVLGHERKGMRVSPLLTTRMEKGGWVLNESGSHALIWRGSDCIFIETGKIRNSMSSEDSMEENWIRLRRNAMASLVSPGTIDQMGFSEDGNGIFITTENALIRFSHPSLGARVRLDLPLSGSEAGNEIVDPYGLWAHPATMF